MKKWFVLLMSVVMALCMVTTSFAAENTAAGQVVYAGGSIYYDKDGNEVENTTSLDGDAVVMVKKTIEQYKENNKEVENEFVVTLQVQTSQDVKQIASDTPNSAVLLVMDVSNSMDDCIHCGEEASHSKHSGTSTTVYYCSDTSGETYQPGRRGRCSNCGKNQSAHNAVTTTNDGTCGYEARLAATKVAAKDFLHEFAYETGAQDGDERMVAIVAYGTHAVTALNWVDITSTEGMYAAEQAIEGLTIANNNQSQRSGLRGGGTSIESGLALGRNLLGQSEVSEIDYRYAILLTDGQPTYPASDANSTRTDYVYGSTGNNGSSTQEADMDDVAAIAQAIRNQSKLYSVCFGKVGGADVWNLTPFGNWSGSDPSWSTNESTTIGSWLSSFSTAYKADDASSAELFDVFSSIMAQIQVAAKAWKVEDWMGPHMVYGEPVSVSNGNGGVVYNRVNTPNAEDYTDHENGVPAFVWDLLGSENDPDTDWDASSNTGVLSYTYKYRVTLDNLDSRYSTQDTDQDGWGDGDETKSSNAVTNANTLATLRYATTDEEGKWPDSTDDYETVEFPKPTVQGLVGNLTFTKMVENPSGENTTTPQALAGITFRLRSKDSVANPNDANLWAYVDATSDANGVVTFTGIPSGHSYTLLEAEQNDHYVDLGDIPIEISWGTAVVDSTFENVNDSLVLYNTYKGNALGQITLQKSFAQGSVKPHSIQFKITGKAGTDAEGYSAQRSLYASDAVQGDANTWSWTLKGLRFGGYTIEEVNALDIHGNKLRDTHDLSYEIYVDGAQQPSKSGSFVEGTTDTYPKIDVALSDTDADRLVTVKFVNNMTPKRGTLNISKSFVDLPASMVNANMNLSMKVIATTIDASGAGISGEEPVEITLAWDSDRDAYYASALLPIGRYKLTEEITGTVPGYSLLHYVFAQNNANIENGIVEITDDVTLNVTLKNHYQQDTAHMHISKTFDGELDAAAFAGRVIYVNVYKYDTVNKKKVGEPVATIQLDGGDGSWDAATPELPLGYYYLEEVIDQGVEGTAYTDGYAHKVTWYPGHVVELTTKDQAVNLTLTNTYEKDKGYIQVTKTFAQDSELNGTYFEDNSKQITITIYKAGDTTKTPVYTLTLPVNANGQWSWNDTSIALPVGDYVLEEAGHLVDGYTLSQTWTGVNVGTTNVVTVVNGNTAAIGLENKYTQDKGSLTVSKTFAGIPDTISNDLSVRISITDTTNPANTYAITLPKTSANSNEKIWTDTIELPVGVYQLNEAVSDAEGYTLSKAEWTGLTADNTVTITKAAGASVTITNTYTPVVQTGKLTIEKKFAHGSALNENHVDAIDVVVKRGDAVVANVTLTKANGWKETISLPTGAYTVEEVNAGRPGYALRVDYTGSATGSVSIAANAEAAMTITNTYSDLTGGLVIRKDMQGDPALFPASVEFTVTGNGVTRKATVSALNNWTAYIGGLYPGEYTVTENTTGGFDYDVTTAWSSAGGKVYVYAGASVTLTCTNTYRPKDTVSFRIPVEKTVSLGGAKAPAEEMTFVFGASWQGGKGVTVRFENDPANLLGAFRQTAADAYAATILGAGTVKGYIVIEGYADQLAGFQLTTWETLGGFANEEAAEAAGWTFDRTAADSTVKWTVSLGYNAQGSLAASVARTDFGAAGKVSFENTYTSPIDIPETGDGENPALWVALCSISVLGAALLFISRKRRGFAAAR